MASRDLSPTAGGVMECEASIAEDFLRGVAKVPLTRIDLSHLAANVLYARGSLSREVRREAVVAIKTLREILSAARERLSSPEQVEGESSREANND